MKPIYKPEKMYSEDINDLVEAELEKGGPGSGKRGHKTVKQESWNKLHSDHIKARESGDENKFIETGRRLQDRLEETRSKKVKPIT